MDPDYRRRRAQLGLAAAVEAIKDGENTHLPSVIGVTVIVTHQQHDIEHPRRVAPIVETYMLSQGLAETIHEIYQRGTGVDHPEVFLSALAEAKVNVE